MTHQKNAEPNGSAPADPLSPSTPAPSHPPEPQRKKLPELLSRFRAALEAKIRTVKKSGHNCSTPPTDGRKVSGHGASHRYVFQVHSIFHLPAGAPGEPHVPGKPPVNAVLLSIEVLRIRIRVNGGLGEEIPPARLKTNLTFLPRKQIERPKAAAEEANRAADRMMGLERPTGAPANMEREVERGERRLRALKNPLGVNLAVVWGPPGTGKTHTIGAIMKHLFKSSRSALPVSHANTAAEKARTAAEWLLWVRPELTALETDTPLLAALQSTLGEMEKRAADPDETPPAQPERCNAARRAAERRDLRPRVKQRLRETENDMAPLRGKRSQYADEIARQEGRIERAQRLEPLRTARSWPPTHDARKTEIANLIAAIADKQEKIAAAQDRLTELNVRLPEPEQKGALARLPQRPPNGEPLQSGVRETHRETSLPEREHNALKTHPEALAFINRRDQFTETAGLLQQRISLLEEKRNATLSRIKSSFGGRDGAAETGEHAPAAERMKGIYERFSALSQLCGAGSGAGTGKGGGLLKRDVWENHGSGAVLDKQPS